MDADGQDETSGQDSVSPGGWKALYFRARLPLVILIWIVAVVFLAQSLPKTWNRLTVSRICSAAVDGDPSALEEGLAMVGPDDRGLQIAECLALAMAKGDDFYGAADLLDPLVDNPDADGWLPQPDLLATVAEVRRLRGRVTEAGRLIRRATLAYPQNWQLLSLELKIRLPLEDVTTLLDEMDDRLSLLGPSAQRFRYEMADAYLTIPDALSARDYLGPGPDRPENVRLWHRLMAEVNVLEADASGLAETMDSWRRLGGHPAEVQAFHAVLLSLSSLKDPDRPIVPMLRRAVSSADQIGDQELVAKAHIRLIAHLGVSGQVEEAVALLDRYGEEYDISFTREDLLRMAQGDAPEPEDSSDLGTLAFVLDDPSRSGGAIFLSPEPDEPFDQPFERYAMPSDGRLEIQRATRKDPLRWVFRGAQNRVRASGNLWPQAGQVLEVAVATDNVSEPRSFESTQAPADGRRRVFSVILDAGDWRFVQYGIARRELPFFEFLFHQGQRAVVMSEPAFTAAALKKLVYPSQAQSISFVDLMYQLGSEIESNNFVRANPFSALNWLLPQSPTLFQRLGSGSLVVVNMLNSTGNLDAGRNGQMVGPMGRDGLWEEWSAAQPLTQEERALFREPKGLETNLKLLEELSADLVAAEKVVTDGRTDFLCLRLAAMDLVSHAGFGESATAVQDNGDPVLFGTYRFMDLRLGRLWNLMDQDDLLMVMSDHGIHNGLQHDPRSLFITAGAGMPHGRVDGTPELAGAPLLWAHLFGMSPEDWPSTGLESLATLLPESTP